MTSTFVEYVEGVPPWRKYVGERAERTTLLRWRNYAQKLARARGAMWACDVCKKPLGRENTHTSRRWGSGSYAVLEMRAAQSWGNWVRRKLCVPCYRGVLAVIETLETQGALEHLPAEVTRGGTKFDRAVAQGDEWLKTLGKKESDDAD